MLKREHVLPYRTLNPPEALWFYCTLRLNKYCFSGRGSIMRLKASAVHSDRHRWSPRTPNLFCSTSSFYQSPYLVPHLVHFVRLLSLRPFLFLSLSLFLFLPCVAMETRADFLRGPSLLPCRLRCRIMQSAVFFFFLPPFFFSLPPQICDPGVRFAHAGTRRLGRRPIGYGRITERSTNIPSHRRQYWNNSISSPGIGGAPSFIAPTLYNAAKLPTAWTHTQHRRFVMFIPGRPSECYE